MCRACLGAGQPRHDLAAHHHSQRGGLDALLPHGLAAPQLPHRRVPRQLLERARVQVAERLHARQGLGHARPRHILRQTAVGHLDELPVHLYTCAGRCVVVTN